MNMERLEKGQFTVIGKEGSTADGAGFIQNLWEDANAHFPQIQHLAKKNPDGSLAGIWGAMTYFSRSFLPWEDFSEGLYLAGAECEDDAEAPEGWTKWIIPGFAYLRVACDEEDIFPKTIQYLKENNIPLAGAVHDFTCPQTGKQYMCFPVRKL